MKIKINRPPVDASEVKLPMEHPPKEAIRIYLARLERFLRLTALVVVAFVMTLLASRELRVIFETTGPIRIGPLMACVAALLGVVLSLNVKKIGWLELPERVYSLEHPSTMMPVILLVFSVGILMASVVSLTR